MTAVCVVPPEFVITQSCSESSLRWLKEYKAFYRSNIVRGTTTQPNGEGQVGEGGLQRWAALTVNQNRVEIQGLSAGFVSLITPAPWLFSTSQSFRL